jgi:hypothetical protein
LAGSIRGRASEDGFAIAPEMLNQPTWGEHAIEVEVLLKKVERGEDLNPHLSLLPHDRGVTARTSRQDATAEDKWSEKDFLLHGMNYHHFHLGQKVEKRGHVERTDNVLFAEVTRGTFTVIGIFDHSVFEHQTSRRRLWELRDRISLRGRPPGTALLVPR